MDGTWTPKNRMVSYLVCPSCKQLIKEDQIVKNGYKACWKCAQV